MKNIQVIDSGDNATYDIFQATDEEYVLIFPDGTDVGFVEDFIKRVGEGVADRTLTPLWSRRVDKPAVQGIHGTLFYDLLFKKRFYPNKRDSDLSQPIRLDGFASESREG